MSAFAINFTPNRVTVACDSLAYLPSKTEVAPLGFISKVLALPHLRAAIFSRGMFELTVRAMGHLFLSTQLLTVEDAAETLPAELRGLTDEYCYQNGIVDPASASVLELWLVGYSPREKRMRLWEFMSSADYVPQDDGGQLRGVMTAPRLPEKYMPRIVGTATDKQLVEIIQNARRYFESDPSIQCAAGGEIFATEITPAGLTQTVLHRFADYDQVRSAGAAIADRIVRGDLDVSTVVSDGLYRADEMVNAPANDHTQPPTPPAPAGMPITRQQRRAMERAARKVQAAA